jgi:DNA (cytosine-5)-methyltransferase 1
MRAGFLPLRHERIAVGFAGGGGACKGIKDALKRAIDIAINHDPEAIALHRANNPNSKHFCGDIHDYNPCKAVGREPIGLAWFSPDCKHFSKAKGGRPVSKRIRGLAWVVVRWAKSLGPAKPRVIMLENVQEFQDWGPLGTDGKPCPLRKGFTFRRWLCELRKAGYSQIEWRELRGCDYGAPTIRKRLFLIARRDGQPIVWPAPTHGAPSNPLVKRGKLKPYRTAAECIDFTIPCPSIFLTKQQGKELGVRRPLCKATQRRLGEGAWRFVIETDDPFIVTLRGSEESHIKASASSIHVPARTVSAEGTHLALVTPFLVNTRNGERKGQKPRVRDLLDPGPTVTAKGSQGAIAAVFLEQANTGMVGHDVRKPLSTIVGKGCTQRVIQVSLSDSLGLTPEQLRSATRTCAFLMQYYGEGGSQSRSLNEPAPAVVTKDRMAVVVVTIRNRDHVIVDIGMRMLTPRELFLIQGFDRDYVIDYGINERGERIELTREAKVRMCGNAVNPQVAEALVRANFAHEQYYEAVA